MIANSSWLQAKIREEVGIEPALCPNAIDHSIFHGDVKPANAQRRSARHQLRRQSRNLEGLSRHGGSHARACARALPAAKIRWLVYGQCLLPPDNEHCSYEALGFLQPAALADAYRSADILLSASWYESFPLFPLEAMACGLAVVTTQTGAEEFAQHDVTAEIVAARDVASIAAGLRRLIEDPQRRARLAHAGREVARRLSWPQAVARMEAILLASPGPVRRQPERRMIARPPVCPVPGRRFLVASGPALRVNSGRSWDCTATDGHRQLDDFSTTTVFEDCPVSAVDVLDREGELDLRVVVARLWAGRKWIAASTVVAAAAFVLAALLITPVYRSAVVSLPVTADEAGMGGLGSALGQLSGLASLAGIQLGGESSRLEEALAVLRSRQFTEKFIADEQLMPQLFPRKWDAREKRWTVVSRESADPG